MLFTIFVALPVLLVAPLVLAEEKEYSMAEVQEYICGDKHKDVSETVMECVGQQDFTPYKDCMMECYPGLEGISKDELKAYHCSQSPGDLEKGDECMVNKLKEEGKTEEVKEIMNELKACIEAGLGERK
ncbi:uncharacterized protein LOC129964173 [Argiope bruennichi]|uniref:Uncharacterized protein n=1 Tax=Argiope bruennichi TaxID=94029 RepID=A0A8T0EXX6_ARGBR|nr:uncharacterized protein LOC129964173 [Argiope bruennichi]KAF8781468.1 hypothetical protein HNY73_011859 [Argiope bruennichi]